MTGCGEIAAIIEMNLFFGPPSKVEFANQSNQLVWNPMMVTNYLRMVRRNGIFYFGVRNFTVESSAIKLAGTRILEKYIGYNKV